MLKEISRKLKSALKYYLAGLYHRSDEHHLFLFAGGLAFSLFLCIVPLVLIIFSVLGNILESTSVERQITTMVDRIIPYKNYAGFVKRVISSRINEVVNHKSVAGYVGAAGLLFAASGLFSSMRTILNTIYGIAGETIVGGKLKDFVMVLSVVVFISISTMILPAFEIVKDSADKIALLEFFRFSFIEEMLISVAAFAVIFFMSFVLYYFIPYRRINFKTAALSALFASLMWETAKQMFGYYITHVATLDKIYGTYIFIVVVAFWIYYSSLVFILGAEIGQLSRERSSDTADLQSQSSLPE